MPPAKLHALFADDDPVLGQIVDAALRKAGWSVTIARDAMQAVMFAVRTPPDIVVLDISMPGGNGVQALEKLRASEKTAHIPVLVVSGLTDPALPGKVLDLGAEAFVAKPLEVDGLPQRLRAIIEASRIAHEQVLDAVSRLARPNGTDTESVRTILARDRQREFTRGALEAILEHLRVRRKIVKQQGRWFLA